MARIDDQVGETRADSGLGVRGQKEGSGAVDIRVDQPGGRPPSCSRRAKLRPIRVVPVRGVQPTRAMTQSESCRARRGPAGSTSEGRGHPWRI